MEDKKKKEENYLNNEDLNAVSGGKSGFSGGFCPQTPDRTCGWRAW